LGPDFGVGGHRQQLRFRRGVGSRRQQREHAAFGEGEDAVVAGDELGGIFERRVFELPDDFQVAVERVDSVVGREPDDAVGFDGRCDGRIGVGICGDGFFEGAAVVVEGVEARAALFGGDEDAVAEPQWCGDVEFGGMFVGDFPEALAGFRIPAACGFVVAADDLAVSGEFGVDEISVAGFCAGSLPADFSVAPVEGDEECFFGGADDDDEIVNEERRGAITPSGEFAVEFQEKVVRPFCGAVAEGDAVEVAKCAKEENVIAGNDGCGAGRGGVIGVPFMAADGRGRVMGKLPELFTGGGVEATPEVVGGRGGAVGDDDDAVVGGDAAEALRVEFDAPKKRWCCG
jgi:hypothetical protein